MELSIQEQIFEQIRKANKVLIALPENLTADVLGSGLALRLFLTKLQKDVSVITSGQTPPNLKFLPGSGDLKSEIFASKSLVISVDTAQKKLDEISYQTESEKVHIYLKASGQQFSQEDLSFSSEKFPVDLVIVLGAKSLEDLGKLAERQADLLFETPKVNVDNQPDNEYFAPINLVDITAVSIAEMLAQLLEQYEDQVLDEDIATCLLAGIITKTQSFQHAQTTPKSFLKASELVALGGRQQEIIKHIYKTKPLSLLKLWGRALARMKILEDKKIIYSSLSFTDFERAESSAEEILPALRELLDNISGYKLVALLAQPQDHGQARLVLAVHGEQPLEGFWSSFAGQPKHLGATLGNYQIYQLDAGETRLEDLESKFVETVANLS